MIRRGKYFRYAGVGSLVSNMVGNGSIPARTTWGRANSSRYVLPMTIQKRRPLKTPIVRADASNHGPSFPLSDP